MSAPRRQAMFRERADLYDRIYSWKDYAAEAARIRALLDAEGVPRGARVVEAACGTGSHLVHLRADYAVAGFDLNDGMLRVARRKLPGVPLRRADMRDFRLTLPADAILCLFSSIGYVRPGADLARTAASFFRALRPGGLAVVESWLLPEEIEAGHFAVSAYDGTKASPPEPLKLVRASNHKVERGRSVLDFRWLVVTRDRTETFAERHVLWISAADAFVAVWRAAGFECRWLHPGPISGRGVLLARVSPDTTRSSSRASSGPRSRGRSRRSGRPPRARASRPRRRP